MRPAEDETLDELLRGRIRVLQPRRGPRVSLDALLVAHFAAGLAPRLGRVLDLGCGGGVIALALAAVDPAAKLWGVEVQTELAALARRNTILNGVAERVRILDGNVAQPGRLPLEPGSFDLVVSNPPFHAGGTGRAAPRSDRAISRSEVACKIEDVVHAAHRFLKPRGHLALVFPAERLPDLLATLVEAHVRPRALRPVHSVAGEPARRVLVLARNGYRGGVTVEAPLIVHQDDRRAYTEEAARILGEG